MKFCKKCGVETLRYSNGRCKPCGKAADDAYRASNPNKKLESTRAWRLLNPEKVKAYNTNYYLVNQETEKRRAAARHLADPSKGKAATKTWRANNVERVRATQAAWAEANPEKTRAYRNASYAANSAKGKARSAAWRIANPAARILYNHNRLARKRKAGGKLSRGLVERLLKLQRGRCPCCCQVLGDDFHLDHILPLALGGVNEDWNIQLLRSVCNMQKHTKHPIDFMREKGYLL